MRQGDQVRLVLHRTHSVIAEVNEQRLPDKALSRRHRDFVAAISAHLHPIRPLPCQLASTSNRDAPFSVVTCPISRVLPVSASLTTWFTAYILGEIRNSTGHSS